MKAAGYDEVKTKHGIELVKREATAPLEQVKKSVHSFRVHWIAEMIFYLLAFLMMFVFSEVALRAGVDPLLVLIFRLGQGLTFFFMMRSATNSQKLMMNTAGEVMEHYAKEFEKMSEEMKKGNNHEKKND